MSLFLGGFEGFDKEVVELQLYKLLGPVMGAYSQCVTDLSIPLFVFILVVSCLVVCGLGLVKGVQVKYFANRL